jgi:hypothetical protein
VLAAARCLSCGRCTSEVPPSLGHAALSLLVVSPSFPSKFPGPDSSCGSSRAWKAHGWSLPLTARLQKGTQVGTMACTQNRMPSLQMAYALWDAGVQGLGPTNRIALEAVQAAPLGRITSLLLSTLSDPPHAKVFFSLAHASLCPASARVAASCQRGSYYPS